MCRSALSRTTVPAQRTLCSGQVLLNYPSTTTGPHLDLAKPRAESLSAVRTFLIPS
jgi:hypothetical protein